MDSAMEPFTPFIRVILRRPYPDLRRIISESTGVEQIVSNTYNPNCIYVRYRDSSFAKIAKEQLEAYPQVYAVHQMLSWYFHMQNEPTDNIGGSVRPSWPRRQQSPQRPLLPQPASRPQLPQPALSETLPLFMRCSYCSGFPVPFQCAACGTFYCNVWCQKQHYETHKHSCFMPPLVVMQDYYEVNLLEKMRPNIPDFPHGSANGQQPAPNNMPKGMPEKINVKTTPSQKEHVTPSTQVTTGTGAGTSPSNKMPQGMCTLPAKAKATPLPPNREKAETKPVQNSTARPTSQNAEECSKTVLQQADFPAVGATVKILCVGKNEMYIYDAGPGPNCRPNSHIQLILRCLEEGRKKGNTLTKAPVVGDILLAPFSGEYYRAVVNSVEGNCADVFFVDLGNSEKLEWSRFREILDPDLKSADRSAHEVWIINVSKFTEPIRQKLNELEAEEFELSHVIGMSNISIKQVDLRHPKELYFLSDKLRQLPEKGEEICKPPDGKNIVVASAPETYVPVLDKEVIETSIPAEDGVELIIIDASYLHHDSINQLAVVVKANHKKYDELMAEIRCYGEADANEYNPKQCGELCLVRYESTWTRAMPTDMQSDLIEYMLFDLGVLCTVPSKNVRRFPPKLSRTLYVTDCIVDNPETLCTLVSSPESLRNKPIKVNVKPERDSNDSQHVTVVSVADKVSS